MKKRLMKRWVIMSMAATLAIAFSSSIFAQTTAVRIGTSSPGSGFYAIGVGISQLVNRNTDLNSSVEPVGGSVATMFGLDRGSIEFPLSNSVAAFDAFHGNEPFVEQIEFGMVGQGARGYRQFVVRTASGIETPEDLNGKTLIGERPALTDLRIMTDALIEAYELDNVNIVSTTTTGEAIDALQARTVDAALLPGGVGSGLISSLTQDGNVRFLYIPEEKFQEMMDYVPNSISWGQIPADTYNHQNRPVNAFFAGTGLFAATSLNEETVYEVTKAIFDNLDEFHTVNNEAREWTLERTLENPFVPFHPGAVRYFEEIGQWTPELQSLQDELLQR